LYKWNQGFGLTFLHCFKSGAEDHAIAKQSGRAMRGRCIKSENRLINHRQGALQ